MPLPWLEQCGAVRVERRPPPAAAMSTPAVPRELQLPPSQRAQPEFREQRRQKLKEHMLKRKTFFAYKEENHISR